MRDIRLVSGDRLGLVLVVVLLLLVGCDRAVAPNETVQLSLYQQWQLQPGDQLQGHPVLGGLGDISIQMNGQSLYAPFAGQARQDDRQCLIFSSPDVPAYLFRLCGLSDRRLGNHAQGDVLGKASVVHIATLRRQPDGKWAIVEPSKPILERFLTSS